MKPFMIAAYAASMLLGRSVSVVAEELSPDEVRKAMQEGVRYLDEHQESNGNWSEYTGQQEGGITCLCTLALLNAGESESEEHLARPSLRPQAPHQDHLRGRAADHGALPHEGTPARSNPHRR